MVSSLIETKFICRVLLFLFMFSVVFANSLDEVKSGTSKIEDFQNTQVLLDSSVFEYEEILSFISKPESLRVLINFPQNSEVLNCFELSKVLQIVTPSVYVTVSPVEKFSISVHNCENSKNLKKVIAISPYSELSQLKSNEPFLFDVEKTIQVQICKTGFFEIISGQCKNYLKRNLQETDSGLEDTYKNFILAGKTVPEAVVLMTSYNISNEFFGYLVEELEFFSFGNSTVAGEVSVVSEYISVYDALNSLMYTVFTEDLEITSSVWEQAYNISSVGIQVSDPENYFNSTLNFVEPATYYLKYIERNNSEYPKAVSLTFNTLASFFSSVFVPGSITEGSFKYFYFEIDSVSINLKLDSLFSDNLYCSCEFCSSNYSIFSISAFYSNLGYSGDLFGNFQYKQGLSDSSHKVTYFSTSEEITESACFNFTINLNTSGTSDTYTCKSSTYYENCTDLTLNSTSNTLNLIYNTFGVFAPIQICPSGKGYNETYDCERCIDNCECENSGECDSCIGHFDYSNGLCQNCSEGFTEGIDGPCSECADGFDNDLNTNDKCTVCAQGFAGTNESKCSICAEGWEDSSDGVQCSQCLFNFKDADNGTPCGACAVGYSTSNNETKCDICSELYGRTDNGTCESCDENCYCEIAGNCTSCVTGYIYYNDGDSDNNTGACYEGFRYVQTKHIVSKYFDAGMGYIELVLNVNIDGDLGNTSCSFYFINYELLGEALCTIKDFKTLHISLGQDFSLTSSSSLELSTDFLVHTDDLSMLPIAVTIDYEQVPSITAIITGNSYITTSCSRSIFTYSASSSLGALKSKFTYIWALNDTDAVSFVDGFETETIQLQIDSDFSGSFNLTLTINNNLVTGETTLQVEVVNGQKLSFSFDIGSGTVFKRSNFISISRIEVDSCGCKSTLVYLWSLSPTANVSKKNAKLNIPKNTLGYGEYTISLTLTCGSLKGYASITIQIESSDLVLIMSKSDQSISKFYDLKIDGSKSYDPDGYSLTYSWTFESDTFDTASLTIPKANFESLNTFTVQFSISATGSRTVSKTLKFLVIDDNPLKLSIYGPSTKVSIDKQVIIRGTASQGTASGILMYEWNKLSGVETTFNFISNTMWVLAGNLFEGTAYTFELKVKLGEYWLAATSSFTVNRPPLCQVIESNSKSGSKSTLFNIYLKGCFDLDNADYPLSYKAHIRIFGRYLAYFTSNSASIIGIRFPTGVTGTRLFVCDTLNDCWKTDLEIKISRNLREIQDTETNLFFELQQETDSIYAVTYLLFENVKNEDLLNLMWLAFTENSDILTKSEIFDFVLTFMDKWQENGLASKYIETCVAFVFKILGKKEILNEYSIMSIKEIAERVLKIKNSEEGYIMSIKLLSFVLSNYQIIGVENFEFVGDIMLYQFENYFSSMNNVEILQLKYTPQNLFPAESLVRTEIAISKINQNSLILYVSISSSEYLDDGEIVEYDPVLYLDHTTNTSRFTFFLPEYRFGCKKYNGTWEKTKCTAKYSPDSDILISENGLYKLEFTKKETENRVKINAALYINISLALLMILFVPLIRLIDHSFSTEYNSQVSVATGSKSERNSRLNTEYEYEEVNGSRWYSKHLFLSIFMSHHNFSKVKKFVIIVGITISQISFQLLLLSFKTFTYYEAGICSSVLTMPFSILLILLLKNSKNKLKNVFGALLLAVCLTFGILGTMIFNYSTDWPLTFLLGTSTEIFLTESLIMLIRRYLNF